MTKEQRHEQKQQEDAAKGRQVVEQPKPSMSTVDYGEDAGAGFQNQTQDDVSLPFIDVLQPGSPEVLASSDGGVRAGMIINRVTGEVFEAVDDKPGVVIVPAITEHCYTEWKPKKGPGGELLKGGFVGRHELAEDVVKKARAESPFKAFRMPSGNDLLETFYVFGLQAFEDGSTAPVGFAFGSTKIKAYKSWMYIARAIQVLAPNGARVNPPLFSHSYRITTKMRKDGGNTWFVPVVGFSGEDAEGSRLLPTDATYIAARGVMQAYGSGTLKADYSKTSGDSVASEADPKKAPF